MQLVRPAFAMHPRLFGRGPAHVVTRRPMLSDELRLFGATFLVGFVFVSILIG